MAESQRTVLITGCSSGIGLCTAVQLAQDPGRRFCAIATMRNLSKKDKLEAAAGETLNKTLHIQCLDVCSAESVAECINRLPEKKLDVLVSNAGVGITGPLESISIDTMKQIFETNFFGAVRMIKAVLPAMKQRRKGHIVVISSVMGLQGIPFHDVYAASKFALEGFCESLAVQLLKFNIFISLVEPGPVNTEFEKKLLEDVGHSEFPEADDITVRYFKEHFLPSSREMFDTIGQSPETVAKAVVSIIAKERPPFRMQTNALYTPLLALKYVDSNGELAISTASNMLFRFTRSFYIITGFLKCITCRCCRRRITPS